MKYLVIIFIFICLGANAHAQSGRISYYDTVCVVMEMKYYDINGDGIKDHVIGRYQESELVLPFFIKWGIDTTAVSDSTLPQYTAFRYPDYYKTKASVAFEKFSNDQLDDMLFVFDGIANDTSIVNNDTLISQRDTFDIILLIASSSLRTKSMINLRSTDSVALNSYRIIRLTDSLKLNPLNSYMLPEINISNSLGKKEILENDAENNLESLNSIGIKVMLYPNPSSNVLNIELINIEIGLYSIQLFDKLGNIIFEEDIEFKQRTQNFTKEINWDKNIASGNYYFVLKESNKVLFKENIVIHR